MSSIYSIYIKNFWNYDSSGNRSYTQTRQLVYTIPIDNPERAFIDPVVKCEMGKAGSLEFTVHPNHPLYKAWRQMRTLLYVEYSGTTIFHGRVLTIDVSPMNGNKKIHCEGDLAFLLDSIQPLSHEAERSDIAMNDYIRKTLAEHNDQMYKLSLHDTDEQGIGSAANSNNDPEAERSDKVINVGEIPGEYSGSIENAQKIANTTQKFGSKSWEQTMSSLESLSKEYGGYFRTRYSTYIAAGKEYDICYLDWLENYFRRNDSDQAAIEISKNMIDLSATTEVENIFTVLIPVGTKESKEIYLDGYKYNGSSVWSGKCIGVPDLDRLCQEGVIAENKLNVGYHTRNDYAAAIDNYGYIYKTQKFDNADTQEKLFNYAVEWIINNYIGGLTSFTVTALDLHHYNPSIYTSVYLAGDLIKIKYPDADTMNGVNPPSIITKTLTILSAEYYLHNPEKNKYSIGIPNTILSKTYGASNKKTKTKKSSGDNNNNKTADEEAKTELGEVEETLWNTVMNNYYNHDMYKELDPTQAKSILTAQYLFLKQVKERPHGSAGILMDGWNGVITFEEENLYDELRALKKMNAYGNRFEYIRHIIESQGITSTVGFSTNSDGLVQGSQMLLGQDAEGNNVAINLDGLGGLMSMFGIDGTSGEMFKSIDISGFQNFLKFFKKPETPEEQEAGQGKQTVDIDGEEGSQKTGKDADGNWLIQLNEPITYVDSQGQTQTVPAGTVSAKDFNLAEVPSFKTEFAYIDTVVVRDLYAAKAKIDNLTGSTIVANTSVRTDKLYCNTETVNTRISSPSFQLTGIGESGDIAYLQNCISDCLISAEKDSSGKETGKIAFDFYKIGGGSLPTKTFNLASTTFYKNAVEAAWNNGGKTAYLSGGTVPLSPGGSAVITAYYVNNSGATGQVPSNSAGRPIQVTVNARSIDYDSDLEITPSSANQIKYPSKDGWKKVTVYGDTNLKGENIKSGVSIFGTTGTYSGGGASGCYVDLYPNGDSDISVSDNASGTTLGKLATKLNEVSQYKWVNFYAVVKDSNGNVVSGSRKQYSVRQLRAK